MSSLESKGLYTISKAIRRTHSPRTPILLLLGWAVICVGSPMVCEEPSAGQERLIRIASAGGEPAFALRISAEGRTGVVSVRDQRGAELQSLTCALLRDNTAPTDEELGVLREQFVTQFEVKDFDFDHHADLAGIREFGAKWARYCVWLYDPRQHIFVKDFLVEQLELLTNLDALGNGEISSSHIGPTDVWRAVYRIVGAEGSRPTRQLVPVCSCLAESTAGGEKPSVVVTTRYQGGQAVVQRQDATKMDMRSALSACSSLARQKEKPKSHARK